jgi:predicted ribonuclease YlaK
MAYACADRREVLYSDPMSLFKVSTADVGVPTGVPEKDSSGHPNPDAADNARTIRETKAIVANYRIGA